MEIFFLHKNAKKKKMKTKQCKNLKNNKYSSSLNIFSSLRSLWKLRIIYPNNIIFILKTYYAFR